MKLNKFEKIFVYVIVLGLILIGGYFIFVHQYWGQIDTSQKTLEKNRKELQELNDTLAPLRNGELANSIETRRKDALTFEGSFFPDLTTYETVETALAYFQAHNFEFHTISVNPIKTLGMSLEVYIPLDVEYDLKTLAKGAKDTSDEPEKVEGEFTIGNKKYFVSVMSLTSFQVTDESGNEITTYNEQMQKVIKVALCKYAAANKLKQDVAYTEATFTIKGKFSDYVKLIDDIYAFDHRAMMTKTVVFPRTIKPEIKGDETLMGVDETGFVREAKSDDEVKVEDDTEIEVDITLLLLSVEPMNPLDKVDVLGTPDKADDIVVNQRPAVY